MSAPSVEDRVLIRELYARLYWAHNHGDAAGIKACFTPDGTTVRYSGEVRTPEMSGETSSAWNADPGAAGTRQHHLTNLIVDPDPEGRDDRRACRGYFFVTEVQEPPATIVRWSCFANDVVQKIDGTWLFFRRQITLNHPDTH